jgi:hypothetical protein
MPFHRETGCEYGRIQLLAAIAQAGLDIFAAGALRLRDAHLAHGDIRSLHGALAQYYVHFALEHPGFFRAIFHPDLRQLSPRHPLAQMRNRRFSELIGFFEALRQQGCLADVSAEDAALTHWALVHRLATLLLEGKLEEAQRDKDALCRRAIGLLESGLLRDR